MDELLQKALQRQRELRDELSMLDKFIASYSQVKERRSAPPATADLFSSLAEPKTRRKGRAAQIAAAMDYAEKVILAAGRPLSRSVLLEALESAGHVIEGGDRSKVLGTNLWRSKRFRNLAGAGYWPRSAPIPAQFAMRARRASMLLDEDD